LGDADPVFRLRQLIFEKAKCVAENEARLRVVEWLWQAHGSTVILAAAATANYLRSL
jgi:hypothetical protein